MGVNSNEQEPQGTMARAIREARDQAKPQQQTERQQSQPRAERTMDENQQQEYQPNEPSSRYTTGASGLYGVGSFITEPTAYRSNADLSGKVRRVLEDLLKDSPFDPNYLIELLHVAKGDPIGNASLALSAVVLTARPSAAPDAAVSYFTLVIESSNDGFKRQTISMPGSAPIDIPITPDMIYDADFEAAIATFIQRRYPAIPAGMQFSAQGMVLPRLVGQPDKENLESPFNVALAAASSTLFTYAGGEDDYSLPNASQLRMSIVQERYNVIASAANEEWLDATGKPRRVDVRLELKTGRPFDRNDRSQSLSQNVSESTMLGWMGAALEFFHVPPPQMGYNSSNFDRLDNNESPIAQFFARYVITWMETAKIPSPSRLLFLLSMAESLRRPMNWYSLIRPTMRSSDTVASRNIGLLNLIASGYSTAGRELGLPETNEDETKLQQWLSKVFHPNPIISMDVDLCGPNTWFMKDFADASKLIDSPTEAAIAAHDRLLGAAMVLTNGAIAEYGFEPGGNKLICFPEPTLIPMGTFTGADGHLRDARNIDLLSILNGPDARHDPKIALLYNDTFFPDSQSQRDKCHITRLQLMQQLKSSFKHTGWAFRFTFNPEFISALGGGIAANNIHIAETEDLDAYQGWQDRQYRFADQYSGRYQSNGLYNRGGYGDRGGRSGGTPYRW